MVQVIAHRGARSIAPENTLAAARIAYDSGADLWETDVNVTRDGHLVLIHDETLLRCTNAASRFPLRPSYRVRDFDLAEILRLDAGSYFLDADPFSQISAGNISRQALLSFTKETIPTLEQGLLFTKEKKWKVNLELKPFSLTNGDTLIPDQTLEWIYHTNIPLEQVVISSFKHEWLDRVRIKEPEIEIQALVGENDIDPLEFGDFSFPTYNANALLIQPDQIDLLKAKGKKINLFTVNDPDAFLQFVNQGVDAIFTDFPQWFSTKA